MESSAQPGGVLASEAAAAALGGIWPHTEEKDVELVDGTTVKGLACSDTLAIAQQMQRARAQFPALDTMLSTFNDEDASQNPPQSNVSEHGAAAHYGDWGVFAGSASRLAAELGMDTNNSELIERIHEIAQSTQKLPLKSRRESLCYGASMRNSMAIGSKSGGPSSGIQPSSTASNALRPVTITQPLSTGSMGVFRRMSVGTRGAFRRISAPTLNMIPPLAVANGGNSATQPRSEGLNGTTLAALAVQSGFQRQEIAYSIAYSLNGSRRDTPSGINGSRRDTPNGINGSRRDTPSGINGSRRDTPTGPSESMHQAASGPSTAIGTPAGTPASLAGLQAWEEKRVSTVDEETQSQEEGRELTPSIVAEVGLVSDIENENSQHGMDSTNHGTIIQRTHSASRLRTLPDGRGLSRLVAPSPKLMKRSFSQMSESSDDGPPRWQKDLLFGVGEDDLVPMGRTLSDAVEVEVQRTTSWEALDSATPLEFQRSIVTIYISVLAVVTVIHTATLIALHATDQIELLWNPGAARYLVTLLPSLLLALLLAAIAANQFWKLDWSSGRPQRVATLLLIAASVALEGSASGRRNNGPAVLWAANAVLISCSTSPIRSAECWAWMGVYWVVCFGLLGLGEMYSPGGIEPLSSEVEWWRDLLIIVHLWATCALMVATIVLANGRVMKEQNRARELLANTQKEALLEGKLVSALVPDEVKERFLNGETLIADRIEDGTVMFIYICGYDEVLLSQGTVPTIQWINAVFTAFDHCIMQTSSMVKVETFNNFLLVYSKAPGVHVDECISLAVDMLDSMWSVQRPDGEPTTVRLGLSSGDFTAGIIGSSTPRYSIFGDTVNTASRMASNSIPTTMQTPFVHLSQTAREQVGESIEDWLAGTLSMSITPRGGGMEIKGKGWIQTYQLSLDESTNAPEQSALAES